MPVLGGDGEIMMRLNWGCEARIDGFLCWTRREEQADLQYSIKQMHKELQQLYICNQ